MGSIVCSCGPTSSRSHDSHPWSKERFAQGQNAINQVFIDKLDSPFLLVLVFNEASLRELHVTLRVHWRAAACKTFSRSLWPLEPSRAIM